MDTRIIEVRKNVIISRSVTSSTFSALINIDFIPDEVNIKLIRFLNTGGAVNRLTGIYSDLISDFIGSCGNSSVSWENSSFTLNKPINGIYTFTFLLPTADLTSLGTPQDRTGDITIHLDFVKYKTVKPVKVY